MEQQILAKAIFPHHPPQTEAHPASAVLLIISPTIEGDYRHRGAFPGLRSDRAEKRSGKNLVFRVSIQFAREVLEDARDRRFHADCVRGLCTAYSALVRGLETSLHLAEGAQEDPGKEAWTAATKSIGCHPPVFEWDDPTTFKVGDKCMDQYGSKGVVVSGYGMHKAASPDGILVHSDGTRYDLRFGYRVQKDGGTVYFCLAGDLYCEDGRVKYLRLVRPA